MKGQRSQQVCIEISTKYTPTHVTDVSSTSHHKYVDMYVKGWRRHSSVDRTGRIITSRPLRAEWSSDSEDRRRGTMGDVLTPCWMAGRDTTGDDLLFYQAAPFKVWASLLPSVVGKYNFVYCLSLSLQNSPKMILGYIYHSMYFWIYMYVLHFMYVCIELYNL